MFAVLQPGPAHWNNGMGFGLGGLHAYLLGFLVGVWLSGRYREKKEQKVDSKLLTFYCTNPVRCAFRRDATQANRLRWNCHVHPNSPLQ